MTIVIISTGVVLFMLGSPYEKRIEVDSYAVGSSG